MIDFTAVLAKKAAEGKVASNQKVNKTFCESVRLVDGLKKKVVDDRIGKFMAKPENMPKMPTVNISVPKLDPVKQFFDDRQYDDKPFKLDGPANMAAVQKVIREEQDDEFMHRDDNTKTFNIFKENDRIPHPYDEFYRRKRDEDDRPHI